MNCKYILYAFFFFSISSTLSAQTDDEYSAFVKQQMQEYEDFVKKDDADFANFLKEYWKEFKTNIPIERPVKPEPKNPVIFEKKKTDPIENKIPVSKIDNLKPIIIPTPPVKKPQTPPIPVDKPQLSTSSPKSPVTESPVNQPEILQNDLFSFSFYGTLCTIPMNKNLSFSLNGSAEKDVAAAWEQLCRHPYQKTIEQCKIIKEKFGLNDWGYVLLTKKIAEEYLKNKGNNEITVMRMFLLCQSGYKVKIGRSGNNLTLLIPSTNMIYATSFLTIDGIRYYLPDRAKNDNSPIYTYHQDLTGATGLVNMNINSTANLAYDPYATTHTAPGSGISITSKVNKNLIKYYNDFPQCDFSVYATAPVSKEIKESVLPPLSMAIQGKDKVEAANLLINFVQTAFKYKTDPEQFGYEKPFFAEELFYYPYSDCEDRAVLYSYLVRTLLGLDVVLLDYPNHIATAVSFDQEIKGDYITLGSKKYLVCDPTYIGASIGNAMPQFRNVAAKVLKYE